MIGQINARTLSEVPDPNLSAPLDLCLPGTSDKVLAFFVQLVGQPDVMRSQLKFVLWRFPAIPSKSIGSSQTALRIEVTGARGAETWSGLSDGPRQSLPSGLPVTQPEPRCFPERRLGQDRWVGNNLTGHHLTPPLHD
jgi:hypothetical protein